MPLTNVACLNAKPDSKPYKLTDGESLYLHVMPNGSKYWRMKYRFLGKEKQLAFGVYPEVSLLEAREQRFTARKQLRDGIDPAAAKRERKLRVTVTAANTFQLVARE